MKNAVISTISDKTDYLTALEAITGGKQSYTQEEQDKLLEIYTDGAKNNFGFEDPVLVKAVLALDVPGANLLDKADADGLATLCAMYADWDLAPEKAVAVQYAALNGNVSAPLSLALARAALDAYAGQKDIAPYREEINSLAGLLKTADEEKFHDASVFLVRVRERAR